MSKRTAIHGLGLLGAAVALSIASTTAVWAHAGGMTVTVTREAPFVGEDASTSPGDWTVTTTDVVGHAGFVWVRLYVPGTYVEGTYVRPVASCARRPVVGQSFLINCQGPGNAPDDYNPDDIPAARYEVRVDLVGGKPGATSATIVVNHP